MNIMNKIVLLTQIVIAFMNKISIAYNTVVMFTYYIQYNIFHDFIILLIFILIETNIKYKNIQQNYIIQ